MPSMQVTKTDPHDVLEIAPDVVLVARAAADYPSLAPDAIHRAGDRQPNMQPNTGTGFAATSATPDVDTSFRATDTSGGQARGGWARRALFTFLFTSCSALAFAAWQHYGDDAQDMVAGLPSQIMPALTSWLPGQKPAAAPQPDATDTASVQQAIPSPPAAAQAPDNATAAAAVSPVASATAEQMQKLQSMARDVASLTQQIDELKATVAQLKAAQEKQEQASREKPRAEARVSEAKPVEPRPSKLGAPPRPLGTVVQRAPRPSAYPPPQAGYAPAPLPPPAGAAPVQIAPPPPTASASDGDPVVRPPMPVH